MIARIVGSIVSAFLLLASPAKAQINGTVTSHAFAIGKGAGVQGYKSLLCASAQLAVGQAAADPICQTITGDAALTAGGVLTVTKTNGVAFGPLATGTSATLLSGTLQAAQFPALSGDVTTGAGSLTATIAANAVTNAKLATMLPWTIKMNNTSGVATPTDTTIDGLTLKASPASSDEIPIWDASGTSMKKATVSSIASAGSVGSFNGRTGAVVPASGDYTAFFPGGELNRFRNGTFDIFQRGISGLATSTASRGIYAADGWRVQQTGATGACGQDVGAGSGFPLFSLKCISNTTSTDTIFIQPIESRVAAAMAGQTVTFQIRYKQTSGSSATPKISTCFPSATDNYTTCTSDLASTSLTSCSSGSWCLESYTFNVSSSASQGYQVSFDCNVSLTGTNACWISAADIRVTPGVTTGINGNPPPMEQRSVAYETAFCQRYFVQLQATSANMAFALAFANSSSQAFTVVQLPVPMMTAPSFNSSGSFQYVASGATFTASSISIVVSSQLSPDIAIGISGATAGTAGFFRDNGSGNAILQFSSEL